MSTPLDQSKPLWQLHVIEGVGKGSALVARLHHCIADGIALIQVLLSLTDPSARVRNPKLTPPRSRNGFDPFKLPQQLLSLGLLEPARALELAANGVDAAATLAELVLMPPDARTVLKGELGVTKRAAWSRLTPLADLKTAGTSVGATVNDVLISAVAGALRRYLAGRGEDVRRLEIRAGVPVNLRPIERGLELGNSFGIVFVALPIGIEDPRRRLAEVKLRLDKIKASSQAIVSLGVLNLLGTIPKRLHGPAIEFFGGKGSLVLTNVPGPREPLYLAGSKIGQAMFWVPQSGRMGLGVSILSYAGGVMVGVNADAGLVPDPEAIVEAFEAELAALTKRRAPARASRRPARA
jgi:WS/DGAT/MGAT family acyltransferase